MKVHDKVSRVVGCCSVFLSILLYGACGGGPVPDVPPDAMHECFCVPGETLLWSSLKRYTEEATITGGVGAVCPTGTTTITGSCISDFANPSNFGLASSGYLASSVGREGWLCSWHNVSTGPHLYTDTVTCLEPSLPSPLAAPSHCSACPSNQKLESRLNRVLRTDRVAPGQVKIVEAECDTGGTLLGGGCAPPKPGTNGIDMTLVSIGIDGNKVECAWRNSFDEEIVGTADAMCVYPPEPGAAQEEVPIAERIARVTKTKEFSADSLQMIDISCDLGDYMLWASCGLENPTDITGDVYLLHSGFIEHTAYESGTWQCGWDIPPDVTTAKGIATALCLKPTRPLF